MYKSYNRSCLRCVKQTPNTMRCVRCVLKLPKRHWIVKAFYFDRYSNMCFRGMVLKIGCQILTLPEGLGYRNTCANKNMNACGLKYFLNSKSAVGIVTIAANEASENVSAAFDRPRVWKSEASSCRKAKQARCISFGSLLLLFVCL